MASESVTVAGILLVSATVPACGTEVISTKSAAALYWESLISSRYTFPTKVVLTPTIPRVRSVNFSAFGEKLTVTSAFTIPLPKSVVSTTPSFSMITSSESLFLPNTLVLNPLNSFGAIRVKVSLL